MDKKDVARKVELATMEAVVLLVDVSLTDIILATWRASAVVRVLIYCLPRASWAHDRGFPPAKGYTCSRDSANNPECYYDWNSGTHTPSPTYNTVTPSYSYYSPNGGNNGPADSNNPNNGSGNPSATFISTSSRSSSRTSSIPTSSPTGFPASNAQSGAVSNRMGPLSFVGVAPVLLLIGVGLWC